MGRPSDWVREVTGRAPMRSPGAPGHPRSKERDFWEQISTGRLLARQLTLSAWRKRLVSGGSGTLAG